MRRLIIPMYVAAITWSILQLSDFILRTEMTSLVDASITTEELMALVHLVVVVLGVLVCGIGLKIWRESHSWNALRELLTALSSKDMAILSALTVLPGAPVQQINSDLEVRSVPATAIFEPGVALFILKRLLQQRKDLGSSDPRVRLTEESSLAVYELRQVAVEAHRSGIAAHETTDECADTFLEEIGATEIAEISVSEAWDVVIRLYGFPYVESRSGRRAEFGKKRSVEVLAWLGMNMDRPRRSAVRTAVWDIEISDASFSTVMSDIRRGISSIAVNYKRDAVFPPTFTDSIDIGVGLTTDFDLLYHALTCFRNDKECAQMLAAELRMIRDIPFAGVNYIWADLDGTTTRLVMLALQAATELAEWAQSKNDFSLCDVAVKAGLRVMPGHEELLAIQHSFISQKSMSQG